MSIMNMPDLKDAFRLLRLHLASYSLTVERMELAGRDAREHISSVQRRLSKDRDADSNRRADLEALLKDSPREELARIDAALKADARETGTAAFWADYYRQSTGTLHEQERQRLRKRKKQLEAELLRAKPSTEEKELQELRLKRYDLTDSERELLKNDLDNMTGAVEEVRTAAANLRDSVQAVSVMVEEVAEMVSADGFERTTAGFVSLTGELSKLLKSGGAAL